MTEDYSDQHSEPHDNDAEPTPIEIMPPKGRERIKPKPGLGEMIYRVVELRLRGRMHNGKDAGEAWVMLRPEELELLDDVADTLEWLRLQRMQANMRKPRR